MKIYKENKKFGLKLNNDIILESKFDYIYYVTYLNLYLVFIGKYEWEWSEESDDFFENNKPWIDKFRDDYFIGELKNGKFGLLNELGKEITSVNYTSIEYPIQEKGENLFIVNQGGRLFKYDAISIKEEGHEVCIGGKWGVLTTESKIIVPIEYDSIDILRNDRTYIYAQNNGSTNFNEELEYDVYDFKGNKILKNKPDYVAYKKAYLDKKYTKITNESFSKKNRFWLKLKKFVGLK